MSPVFFSYMATNVPTKNAFVMKTDYLIFGNRAFKKVIHLDVPVNLFGGVGTNWSFYCVFIKMKTVYYIIYILVDINIFDF